MERHWMGIVLVILVMALVASPLQSTWAASNSPTVQDDDEFEEELDDEDGEMPDMTEIVEAIQNIIQEYGMEVLSDPEKLKEILRENGLPDTIQLQFGTPEGMGDFEEIELGEGEELTDSIVDSDTVKAMQEFFSSLSPELMQDEEALREALKDAGLEDDVELKFDDNGMLIGCQMTKTVTETTEADVAPENSEFEETIDIEYESEEVEDDGSEPFSSGTKSEEWSTTILSTLGDELRVKLKSLPSKTVLKTQAPDGSGCRLLNDNKSNSCKKIDSTVLIESPEIIVLKDNAEFSEPELLWSLTSNGDDDDIRALRKKIKILQSRLENHGRSGREGPHRIQKSFSKKGSEDATVIITKILNSLEGEGNTFSFDLNALLDGNGFGIELDNIELGIEIDPETISKILPLFQNKRNGSDGEWDFDIEFLNDQDGCPACGCKCKTNSKSKKNRRAYKLHKGSSKNSYSPKSHKVFKGIIERDGERMKSFDNQEDMKRWLKKNLHKEMGNSKKSIEWPAPDQPRRIHKAERRGGHELREIEQRMERLEQMIHELSRQIRSMR